MRKGDILTSLDNNLYIALRAAVFAEYGNIGFRTVIDIKAGGNTTYQWQPQTTAKDNSITAFIKAVEVGYLAAYKVVVQMDEKTPTVMVKRREADKW